MTRITIDPITRLEGHGKIDIFLDDNGDVADCYFIVPELRGFEAFGGQPVEEMPASRASAGVQRRSPPGRRAHDSFTSTFRRRPSCANLYWLSSWPTIHHFFIWRVPTVMGLARRPAERSISDITSSVSTLARR
jgi:F420-non-reducing hydrogenase large subunit